MRNGDDDVWFGGIVAKAIADFGFVTPDRDS